MEQTNNTQKSQMTKEDAVKIIEQVASQFNGNLKDHQTIQEALFVIKEGLFKEK